MTGRLAVLVFFSRLGVSAALLAVAAAGCNSSKGDEESTESEALDTAPYAGSPSVIAVDPPVGAAGVFTDKVIRVFFDDHLDADSIAQERFDLHSGPVGRWIMAYYDPVDKALVVWPSAPMIANTVWVLDIKEGLLGLAGDPIMPGQVARFQTGGVTGDNAPFEPLSYPTDIAPIFTRRCIRCHGAERAFDGLLLHSPEAIGRTASGVTSKGWPSFDRVRPDRPGLSYLLYKIIGDSGIRGLPMPRTLDGTGEAQPLEHKESKAISDWIAAGAPLFDSQTTNE